MSTSAHSSGQNRVTGVHALARQSRGPRLGLQAGKSAGLAVLLAILAVGAADNVDLPEELQFLLAHLDIAAFLPEASKFASPEMEFLFWVLPVNALFYGSLVFVYFSWRAGRAKESFFLPLGSGASQFPARPPQAAVPCLPQAIERGESVPTGDLQQQPQDLPGHARLLVFPGGRQTSNSVPPGLLPEQIGRHSAVSAWKELRPDSLEPARVELLRFKNIKKREVYRLSGVGPCGKSIIAKRSQAPKAGVERLIYEEVLPVIRRKAALRYYGYVADPNPCYAWQFLEEAEGRPYSALDPAHRAAAGRWLAQIHSAELPAEILSRLASREPADYLKMLRECRRILLNHLVYNPGITDDLGALFSRMIRRLFSLESLWGRLQRIFDAMPRTLVHGDFATKNIRIRDGAWGPELLVFDWEHAGWGVPAVDLAQVSHGGSRPDLHVYHSTLKRVHPHLQWDDIQRAAACGNVFRLVNELRWALTMCDFASRDFLLKPTATLEAYETPFDEALHEVEIVWT